MALDKEILDVLGQINEKLKTIETGLYGDEKNRQLGVIRRVEIIEQRIDDHIDKFEKYCKDNDDKNLKQDAEFNGRKLFVDNSILWMGRILAGIVIAISIVFFLTGKIGLLDLLK